MTVKDLMKILKQGGTVLDKNPDGSIFIGYRKFGKKYQMMEWPDSQWQQEQKRFIEACFVDLGNYQIDWSNAVNNSIQDLIND